MPRLRRRKNETVHPPQNSSQVGGGKKQAARPTVPSPSLVEEPYPNSGLGGQSDLLANPNLLPAQRASAAGQIGQIQGNRHLQRVVSAARHNLQRQDEAPVVHQTIRYGSRGPSVSEAQGKLNTAGAAPPLAVDSIFGPLTRAAVVEFQTENHLAADGIVGPITWGALDAAQGGGELPNMSELRWLPEDQLRLAGQAYASGPLNAFQASRVVARINTLSDAEYDYFRTLLDAAGSDVEWAFLCKALAANRSMDDISQFAFRINGMSERWLMRNCMVVNLETRMDPDSSDPEERGIMQQYGNSCGPTSVQLLHAQADPIYALELRSGGPVDVASDQAVTDPNSVGNDTLADEQAAILNTHAAAGTGNAPTDRAVGGGGAWVESDMNALASATGVTYTTQIIGSGITMDAAIAALYSNVAGGVQVPIIVGGGTGASNTSHYVVVLIVSGSRFLIHDVWSGDSVWRTEAQFRTNTLNLPSGWNFFVAIDVPSLVPPPLPEPPGPTGG